MDKAYIEKVMQDYGFDTVDEITRIPEAENGVVCKVRFDGINYMVKKMHRTMTLPDLLYIDAFTAFLHEQEPAVAVFKKTTGGQPYILYDGALLVVGEWLPGQKIRSCEPWLIEKVAGMMARLHRQALAWPVKRKRPDSPTLGELDWERNLMYDMNTVSHVLLHDPSPMFETAAESEHPHVSEILSKRDLIFKTREQSARWAKELKTSGRPLLRAAIHGDIYNPNLLWDNRRICGIVDWDCCQYEPLVYELGRVLYEYAKEPEQGTMNKDRAACFLEAYFKAGGPVPEDQMDLVIPYIRMLRILEILFYVQNAVIGDYWSAAYSVSNIRALENLPDKLG